MSEPLIQVEDFEVRFDRDLSDKERTRVEALIDDASALVRSVAGVDFTDENGGGVPDEIIPVVVAAVRRAIQNPDDLTSESIGNYSWQRDGGEPGNVFLTSHEKRVARRAAGKGSWRSVELQADPGFDNYGPRMWQQPGRLTQQVWP